MQILKFGGASVKDAQGVKNIEKVLKITGTIQTIVNAIYTDPQGEVEHHSFTGASLSVSLSFSPSLPLH